MVHTRVDVSFADHSVCNPSSSENELRLSYYLPHLILKPGDLSNVDDASDVNHRRMLIKDINAINPFRIRWFGWAAVGN